MSVSTNGFGEEALMGNEWAWPDGLAALESHCVEEHADAEQTSTRREARRLLRKALRFLFGG